MRVTHNARQRDDDSHDVLAKATLAPAGTEAAAERWMDALRRGLRRANARADVRLRRRLDALLLAPRVRVGGPPLKRCCALTAQSPTVITC